MYVVMGVTTGGDGCSDSGSGMIVAMPGSTPHDRPTSATTPVHQTVTAAAGAGLPAAPDGGGGN